MMDQLKLLRFPVVQDLAISLALNPHFRDAKPVREIRSEILSDLQQFRQHILGIASISGSSRPLLASSSDLRLRHSERLAAARVRGIESNIWGETVASDDISGAVEVAALRVHGTKAIHHFFSSIEKAILDVASDADRALRHSLFQTVEFHNLCTIGMLAFGWGAMWPTVPLIRAMCIVFGSVFLALFNPLSIIDRYKNIRSWSKYTDQITSQIAQGKKVWWLRGSSLKLYSFENVTLGRSPSRPPRLKDLLSVADSETINPVLSLILGPPPTAHLYVDRLFCKDSESGEPVLILTARKSSSPLQYAPETTPMSSALKPAISGRSI